MKFLMPVFPPMKFRPLILFSLALVLAPLLELNAQTKLASTKTTAVKSTATKKTTKSAVAPVAKKKLFKVVIDPGHGGKYIKGKNDGSTGSHGASYNNAADDKSIQVTLTRGGDTSISAMMRAAIAVEQQADIYLSIHFNSGGGKGPRAYVVSQDHPAWEYTHFTNPYIKRDIVLGNHLVKSLELAFKPFGGQPSAVKVFNDSISPSHDHGLGKGNLIDGIRSIGYARMDTHLFNAAVVLLEVEFLDTKGYSEFLTGSQREQVKQAAAAYMATAIKDYQKAQVLLDKPVPSRKLKTSNQ